MNDSQKHVEGLLAIGKMALEFARTNRTTFHEDGIRQESDTDHTVMLALSACALGDALYKGKIDLGKVAQFALIHDLVEVYAGDTMSVNLTKEGKEDKDKREASSLQKIERQFMRIYPWITETINEYESLESKEARFVKVLDKVMTRITNILDNGAAIRHHGLSYEEMRRHYGKQREIMETQVTEFPELLEVVDVMTEYMFSHIYGEKHVIIQ
jgi:putative hydrolase of HD superfamily